MLILRRCASTLAEIQKLVPNSKKITLVQGKQATQGIAIQSLVLKRNQQLQIVNVAPKPGSDPEVAVKIIDQKEAVPKYKQNKQKPAKPAQIKEMMVSWNISAHDLEGQKIAGIKSVLTRGHNLQLKLHNKTRLRRPLSEFELESRKALVQRIKDLTSEIGQESKPSVGSISSSMTMFLKSST